MHSIEIKKKFIDFFKSKGHKQLANVSLIPENDPTALFINSGVHPIVPNILQGSHPLGKRLCGIQRCMRTTDIEEVGDNRHHTFFEMLGNWSIGDYFKKEALYWSMEFFVDILGLDPKRIYASVFKGDKDIPEDTESIDIWLEIYKKYGISASVFEKDKFNEDARIFLLGKEENFWGPAGTTGPCGPNSEFHYYVGKGKPDFEKSRPGYNDGESFIELWNNVFMEFNKDKNGKLTPLKKKNVDTGAGFERICLIMQFREEDGSMDKSYTVYNTDLFDEPLSYIRSQIEDESRKSTYKENRLSVKEFDPTITNLKDIKRSTQAIRIILDHMRASVFLVADGIEPSNKDQGYILRRLIRRAVRFSKELKVEKNILEDLAILFIDKYKSQYPYLEDSKEKIINSLEKEVIKFEKTLLKGIKEIEKLKAKGEEINGDDLFYLYETYGFPVEMALEELEVTNEKQKATYLKDFDKSRKKHIEESKKGSGKFTGGLADHTEISKRYHTSTHLLLKALQIVLGNHVHQRGSNITSERLRFDFSHNSPLTESQIKEVEKIVNEKINSSLEVSKEVMSKKDALKTGAECEFPDRYPDTVSVYTIKDKNEVFSKEFCGGPHVKNISELKKSGKFRIIKEESSSAGVRRIRAVLE